MKLAIVGAAAALVLLAGCSSWNSGGGGGSGPAMSSEPVDQGNNTAGVVSAPTQPAGGAGLVSGGSAGTNGTPTNAAQPQ